MTLRAWLERRDLLLVLIALMLIMFVFNGALLLSADLVWAALGQIVAILILGAVSIYMYYRSWLDAQRRRILIRIAEDLTHASNCNEQLDYIVRASLQLIPLADKSAIHLLDSSEKSLRLAVASHPDETTTTGIPVSGGPLYDMLHHLQARRISDLRSVQAQLPFVHLAGGSLIGTPLHVRGKALGTLCLYSRVSTAFSHGDQQCVALLAAHASAVLDRALRERDAPPAMAEVSRLLGDVTDGVVILDASKHILYYSPSLAALLGTDVSAVVGQRVAPDSDEEGVRWLADILSGCPAEPGRGHEFRVDIEQPFPASFQVYVSPMLDQDRQWKQIVVLHECTEEQDVILSQANLMAATLQESDPSLRSVRVYTTLLLSEEAIGAATKPWAGQSREHIVRLMYLVQGLQDLVAMQEHHLVLRQEVTPLWPMVKDVLAELAEPAQRAGVSFELRFSPDLSSLLCDPDRTRCALFLVLDNALHRGVSGGHIRLEIGCRGEHLVFSIADDGQPLTSQTRERIEQGLAPSRVSASEEPADTGLGLYLSRRLVEAHGGHLWLAEDTERGTECHFILPSHPVWGSESPRQPL